MRRSATALLAALLAGCGYTGFEEFQRVSDEELAGLTAKAPYPDLVPRVQPDIPSQVESRPDGTRVVRLTLREALRLVERNNQRFLESGENLELQLLSLRVIRHFWTPLVQPLSGSASWTSVTGGDNTGSQSITAGATQKLPFGASASVFWNHFASQFPGADSYQGTATASLTVPLLRDAGMRVAAEELVSAERSYVYALRAYEFNRLELLVQTVQSYFGQLQQEKNIANLVSNLERRRRQLRHAELREEGGLTSRQDVYTAQIDVTNAENDLSNAREDIKLARNAFKIDLGLHPEDELILAEETIAYRPLKITLEQAVADALRNNPEWLTARNRLEDATRDLAIARSRVLPQFDVTASYSWSQDPVEHPFDDVDTGDRSFTLAGVFSIPLDRLALDRDYQAALITYKQAERNLARTRDAFVRTTQDLYVAMLRAETTMKLQERNITQAERQHKLIDFRYQRGQAIPLEVARAQDDLLRAQNSYLFAQVGAKISQLRLLRWIGRLEIDDEGRWLQ